MTLSRGRDCDEVCSNPKVKRAGGTPALRNGLRGRLDDFLLPRGCWSGGLKRRILLGVDALEDTKKIGAAVWPCARVGEVNDGSVFAGWVGYEWVRTYCAYGPEEIGV